MCVFEKTIERKANKRNAATMYCMQKGKEELSKEVVWAGSMFAGHTKVCLIP